MKQIIAADSAVEQVGELTVQIQFRHTIDIQQLEFAIDRIKQHIREQDSTMAMIFIDPAPESSANRQMGHGATPMSRA